MTKSNLTLYRPLLLVIVLLAFSGNALSQITVANPFRTDSLLAVGGSAIITGGDFAGLEADASPFGALPTELSGITITIDQHPAGIWIVFATTVCFTVPADLTVTARASWRILTLTTPTTEWRTLVRVAVAAPGLACSEPGRPAGMYRVGAELPRPLSAGVPITTAGTLLILVGSGVRAERQPMRLRSLPFEGFEPDCYVWIGDRRLPAQSWDWGYPGMDQVFCFLPPDLLAGEHDVRVEARRVLSDSGLRLVFFHFQK